MLVPKIGSCEHCKNDLPTHESVSLKKWMGIEHALLKGAENNGTLKSDRASNFVGTKNWILENGSCDQA